MISQYLQDLFYEHNCVILPGFGGFIANRLPSKVNEIQQRVEPARKVVAFNINLTQHDGLLATHLSIKKSITFDEATWQILEFVAALKTEIQLKRHSALKGIGDFYLNSEDKIVFIPESDINFAKDTFGLFPITIRKILRENEEALAVEKENTRSQPLPPVKPKTRKLNTQGSRKWVYSTLLIALPLTIGLFMQHSGILQKADFNIGNIFKQQVPAPPLNNVTEVPKTVPLILPETSKTETLKTEVTATPATPPLVPAPSKVEQNTQTVSDAVASDLHYHVIGGSFAVPNNAQNFTTLLRSKGYQAYTAGTSVNGLAMISYKGFTTEVEAIQFLQIIHQTENAQAWLFKK